MRSPLATLLVAAFVGHVPPLLAAEPRPCCEPRWNQVELSADASREVANDTVYASLFTELNDPDPAKLAAQVNRVVADALKAAGGVRAVKASTGGNMTYPVYDKQQKIAGWRSRAEVRLESQDFEAAANLIGKLQASMQLGSVSFGTSRELRKRTEDELIKDAVAAFRSRADVATSALGSRSYRIQRLALNAGGPPPMPMFRVRAMSADAAPAAAPPPALEGGTSVVQVIAIGTIEIE
jgi:predicted secreted protein